MVWVISNPKEYSEQWGKESQLLESHGIYEQLAKLTPSGKVLEFGCGLGIGTRHLSIGHDVLSLDSNEHLINEANRYLDNVGAQRKIHKCDFFELSGPDKQLIREFAPTVIVGWFIGSHGMDIFKHTDGENEPATKSKLYREKIEDIIMSSDICLSSVECVHLVNRSGLVVGFSEAEQFKSTKDDYDTYVFRKVGFEVTDVKNLAWPRDGSQFQYGKAPNPNLAKGEAIPAITSILAGRIK